MKIYLYDGFAAVFTEELNVDWHSHTALQIVIALDQNSLECETAAGVVSASNILIPGAEAHRFLNHTGSTLILLIDHESTLSKSFARTCIQSIPQEEIGSVLDCTRRGSFELTDLRDALLNAPLFKALLNRSLDERIIKFVDYLRSQEQGLPSAEEAASYCHLSVSRFLHLFKQELGLPFRKYLLWLKLRRVFFHLQNGQNLTAAALAAGFSDSAHFSRVFTSSFGENPSEILKNSQFIQAK